MCLPSLVTASPIVPIRCCFVDTELNFNAFIVFPPNDSIIRCNALPSIGSSWVSSPTSWVLWRHYDYCYSIPPHFVSFAWQYLFILILRSSHGWEQALESLELLSRNPHRTLKMDVTVSPRFLGNLLYICSALRPRSDKWYQVYKAPLYCSRFYENESSNEKLFEALSHSFCTCCLRFTLEIAS